MFESFGKCLALPVALLSYFAPFVSSLPHNARTVIAQGTELRMLPLGDSITFGWNSTDGTDGYRLGLSEDLSGSDWLFVGTQRSGNMVDNYNEGHSGYTISQIAGVADGGLAERPNIVLLHAGTNDLNANPLNQSFAEASARLGSLIDQIVEACPDAVLLVAQIINAADAQVEARIKTFNAAVPGVVQKRANSGTKIAVVDFSAVTADELIDGLHPTPAGYKQMGDIWFAGIKAVADKGWITAPVGSDPSWAQK